MTTIERIRNAIALVEPRLVAKADEATQVSHDLAEARRERRAAVNGESDACPGVCWTNEERLEDRQDRLDEELKDLERELADLNYDLREAIREEAAHSPESYATLDLA